MKKIRKQAFTLAEVLITLSIIGVVAALTIPTLIQRTGNEELVSKLLKTYSILSQATEAVITENGSPSVWTTNNQTMYEMYKKHIRIVKDCGSTAGQGCWYNGRTKFLDGKNDINYDTISSQNYYRVILADGASVLLSSANSACNTKQAGYEDVCGSMMVDITGPKKGPNTIGRDIFIFKLTSKGLFPALEDGASGGSYTCGEDKGGWQERTGQGCASRVIAEGAMNY